MADRYWVGGTATWDSTAGTKWASTSGGPGGASAPTTSDDVYFDANSGSGTISIGGGGSRNLNTTGFTGVIGGTSSVTVYGDMVIGQNTTISGSFAIIFSATGSSKFITTNGKTLYNVYFYGSTSDAWTLLDNLTITNIVDISRGAFLSNNFQINTHNLFIGSTSDCTVTFGASIIKTNNLFVTATNLTINAGTSRFRFPVNVSSTIFSGGGKTFNEVELFGTSVAPTTFQGNNTINKLILNTSSAHTVKFTNGSTNTFGEIQGGGSAGKLVTFTNTSSTTQATLVKSGGGAENIEYMNISNLIFSPSSTWVAVNSTDSGNNTGITFSTASSGNNLFFGSNF